MNRTPRERLLQHEYGGEGPLFPWRVLVVTLLCQRTTGPQVREVAPEVLERFPTPESLAAANEELEDIMRPAGFVKQRAAYMRGISRRYNEWLGYSPPAPYPSAATVRSWRGVGRYTEQAYRLVVEGDTSFEPEDKELYRFWLFKTSS